LIEVQIRTPLQDNWANMVEIMSRSFAPGLKFGEGAPELAGLLVDLASSYAEIEIGGGPSTAVTKLDEIRAWVDTLEREQKQ
jgi:ppGpp synthetase/RelA/SpoT-type nucleotidyltranferase